MIFQLTVVCPSGPTDVPALVAPSRPGGGEYGDEPEAATGMMIEPSTTVGAAAPPSALHPSASQSSVQLSEPEPKGD